MYRIYIVETEDAIRLEIQKALLLEFKTIEFVGFARTAEKAIKEIKKLEPDISIISTGGPEWNGWEVIQDLKKEAKRHVVMLSYYDTWQFTSKAIDLKTDVFLLKPIDHKKLIQQFRKLIQIINEERKIKEIENKRREREKILTVYAGYSLFDILLNHETKKEELQKLQKVFHLPDEGCIVNISWEKEEKIPKNFYYYIKNCMEEQYYCIIGKRIFNRIPLFLTLKKEDLKEKKNWNQEAIYKNAVELAKQTKERWNYNIFIGIGTIHKIEKLSISYHESLENLKLGTETTVTYQKNKVLLEHPDRISYIETKKKLYSNIQFNLSEVMENFSQVLKELEAFEITESKNQLIEILVVSSYLAQLCETGENLYMDYISLFKRIEEKNWDDMVQAAYQGIQIILSEREKREKNSNKEMIQSAMKYITEHYLDVTLEAVANYVGVSPPYFSKIFKEQTDINYLEWLTDLKIKKGKELLWKTDLAIEEIGIQIGYGDANYFSRIFKKKTGMTPKEFRKRKRTIPIPKDFNSLG